MILKTMGTFCPDDSDKVSGRYGQTVRTVRTKLESHLSKNQNVILIQFVTPCFGIC